MATFVVAHGAWSSGWAWKKMRPLMRAAGHEFLTPSYTGLGEREHLAGPEIALSTHIADLVNVFEFEDLTGVILVGHSFGGMVATGVADRVRRRVDRLIYVDAFVPAAGQCLFDLVPPDARRAMRERCSNGDGWRVPPQDLPPDTSHADRAWAAPRRRPHPIAAFEEPIVLSGKPLPPRSYVYCSRAGQGDVFGPFAAMARREGWPCAEIDASHNPHITAPDSLLTLLERLARG
jgi:pimeloyl-ACP methyl ester carboxylesterase